MNDGMTGVHAPRDFTAAFRRLPGAGALHRRINVILSRRSLTVLKWAVVLTSPLLTISAVLLAPRYLACADTPRQSDAVVLFLGQPYEARKKEALQLIGEDYARRLIMPDRNRVFEMSAAGDLRVREEIQGSRENASPAYERYIEDTHREVIEAKRIMDEMALRSAILVSSPYHMRRIKIISDRVFARPPRYQLRFVPTRFESTPGPLWFLNGPELQRVTSEYMKIAWFLIYSAASGALKTTNN